jgi:hypothetical protein
MPSQVTRVWGVEASWRLDVLIFTHAWGSARRDGIWERHMETLRQELVGWKRLFGNAAMRPKAMTWYSRRRSALFPRHEVDWKPVAGPGSAVVR